MRSLLYVFFFLHRFFFQHLPVARLLLCEVILSFSLAQRADAYEFFIDCIYLCLETGGGREKERERNIHVWLRLMCL